MRLAPFLFALFATLALPVHAGEEEDQRATTAVRVLKEVMQAPDKAIPKAWSAA